MTSSLPGARVLDTFVNAMDWSEVRTLLTEWIRAAESRYVCLCNVHSAVLAESDQDYARVLADADLVLPDGMPVAWVLRHRGYPAQPRIGGPDLMWACCEDMSANGHGLFLYGSSQQTLDRLVHNLQSSFPALKIAGALSPPFHELNEREESEITRQINESGASAVFVALGCPRQEAWMSRHRRDINAVLFGFGAAFDFHAGTVKRAPHWMQESGLEWLHRFFSEPGRLWKRYLVTNSRFIISVFLSALRGSRTGF